MHVLEHADALRLTSEQRMTAETLRARMLAEARTLGARIVALEEELDALFATAAADAGRLAALTASIGALHGRLPGDASRHPIAMREALDRAQRAAYGRCVAMPERAAGVWLSDIAPCGSAAVPRRNTCVFESMETG